MNDLVTLIRATIDDELERQRVATTPEQVAAAALRCQPWWAGRAGLSAGLGCVGLCAFLLLAIQRLNWPLAMSLAVGLTALFAARAAWSKAQSLRQAETEFTERVRTAFQRARIDETPARAAGVGYLYVLRFSTGTIKVGQTVDLGRRLREHRRDAAAFGVAITDLWISAPLADFLRAELELVRLCASTGQRFKQEYFRDIPFAQAVAFAQQAIDFNEQMEEQS
jgi:hypothetical protein